MNKYLRSLCLALLCLAVTPVFAQRKCGIVPFKDALIAVNPSWEQRIEAQRTSLQGIADNMLQSQAMGAAQKTTAASPIPVIFHIMVTNKQLAEMGGYEGVQQRCDSQIAVLNRDFNRENRDSTLIPYNWKPLYGSAGIRFGLAHTQPNGWGCPGYEIRIVPDTPGGFLPGSSSNYKDAKYDATGGANAWDVKKYINVWCFNFADGSGNLGLTMAKSFTTSATANEQGISIAYLALGTQNSAGTLKFPPGGSYIAGRTLTHECGHFFEIWHTWGDDFGKCTWNGGKDDGLADTPPEANNKYGIPVDTIPGGTIYDACKDSSTILRQPIGVATHNFMNYTDDVTMCMFTVQQAAVMASMVAVGGESYTLTQNPELLNWPANAGVAPIGAYSRMIICPNPSNGKFDIIFDNITDRLEEIIIVNAIGQQVQATNTGGKKQDYYSIDLSGMSKGIYFVRCNFASGSITRKILVQ